ncbi:hypothetical protein M911_13695 [Ectothiorhodospira haloalkaliphila]|uniref:Uncharacterized protein n=1 Tax=Ectothiorhodospira haloalkaliphila TaxID=421628 RepID=W8KUT8_9GAMM|nr:hypothetical protein M911_13695 [Ectothiorhodospira haloalkaliphila]
MQRFLPAVIGPVHEPDIALKILQQRRAVLHPVTVIAVQHTIDALDARLVDVAADVAVIVPLGSPAGRRRLESPDILPGLAHAGLHMPG